jgi:hypothetical protein
MNKPNAVMIAFVFGMLLIAARLNAHHSFAAEYDINRMITIKGTIVRFDLVNPHSWLYVDARDSAGKVTKWNIEWGSANTLIRRGVNKTNIPIGTEVTVVGYAARDNSNTMNGTSVRLPDGRTLFTGSEGAGAPPTR